MQTSCHRCPSALHNRLVTSTPSSSSSLSHPPRTRRRVVDRGGSGARGGVGPGPVTRTAAVVRKRWSGHWPGRGGGVPVEEKRVVDHGDSGARGGVARGPVASREKRTYPTDTPPPRPAELLRRVGAAEGFVPVATGLDPAKAATAPGIGIIIEFLPTGPHQTARGETRHGPPDATERHELAQLRPVDRLHAHRL